jgi:hypothetical protein
LSRSTPHKPDPGDIIATLSPSFILNKKLLSILLFEGPASSDRQYHFMIHPLRILLILHLDALIRVHLIVGEVEVHPPAGVTSSKPAL